MDEYFHTGRKKLIICAVFLRQYFGVNLNKILFSQNFGEILNGSIVFGMILTGSKMFASFIFVFYSERHAQRIKALPYEMTESSHCSLSLHFAKGADNRGSVRETRRCVSETESQQHC